MSLSSYTHTPVVVFFLSICLHDDLLLFLPSAPLANITICCTCSLDRALLGKSTDLRCVYLYKGSSFFCCHNNNNNNNDIIIMMQV